MAYRYPETGRWYLRPTSEQQAIDNNKKRYSAVGEKCEHCQQVDPIRWVGFLKSCHYCVILAYNDSRQTNLDNYIVKVKGCTEGPHLIKTKGDGGSKCLICKDLKTEAKRQLAIARGTTPPDHDDLQEMRNPDKWERAMAEGLEWFMPDFRCMSCGTAAPRQTQGGNPGRCQGCESTKPRTPKQAALIAGEEFYIPTKSCSRCNTVSKRRVANGHCMGCVALAKLHGRSARQDAAAAGEKWYESACPTCGTARSRYVANGRWRSPCPVCETVTVMADTDRLLIEAAPDHKMTKETAVALGYGVYREACDCWRYVETGGEV